MKPFGVNLEDLLGVKCIAIPTFARSIGVNPKTVYEWIGPGGRMPREAMHIKRAAELLQVSVHRLLYGEEESSSCAFLGEGEGRVVRYEISVRKLGSRL
jgi:hypothetical protein